MAHPEDSWFGSPGGDRVASNNFDGRYYKVNGGSW